MILIFITSCIVVIFTYYFIRDNWPKSEQPPGPIKIPPFGSLLSLFLADKTHYIALDKLAKQYGKCMHIRMGFQDAVILSSFDAIKNVLSRDDSNNRQFMATLNDRSFKKSIGLGFSNGENWVKARKFCREALKPHGFGNRRLFESRFHYELEEFCNYLKLLGDAKVGGNEMHFTSQTFDPLAMNSILNLLIGERLDWDNPRLKLFIKANEMFVSNGIFGGGILTAYPFLRLIFPKTLGYDTQMNGMKLMYTEIKKIVNEREQNGVYATNPQCFVDEFLKGMKYSPNSEYFNEEQLLVTFADLLQTGFETTSNLLNFTVLLISTHPNVQERLFDEIELVCGRNSLPVLSNKLKMPYTQAVILEILRWSRLAALRVPHSAINDIHYDGFTIRKGSTIITNLHSVFFDQTFWGDPSVFRPERFLDTNMNIITKNSERVIAFGIGSRNCFGETLARDSIFLFTTGLFQRFRFTVPPDKPRPSLEPITSFTLIPQPYTLQIELRN